MFESSSGDGPPEGGDPLPRPGVSPESTEDRGHLNGDASTSGQELVATEAIPTEPDGAASSTETAELAASAEPVMSAGLAGPVEEGYRGPGEVLTASILGARAMLADGTARVVPVLPRLDGGEVAAAMEDLDTLRAHVETLTVHLVLAAAQQGVHTEKGLSLRDWVTARCPGLSAYQINDLATVAAGIADPQHAAIAAQVCASTLPVRRAAAVLRALDRVAALLETTAYPTPEDAAPAENADPTDADPAAADAADPVGAGDPAGAGGVGVSPYQDAVQVMLGVAAQARFSDRDLRRVTDHLTSTVLPARDHESRTALAHTLRRVNESSLADGSLVRFVITCDPEGAAVFRAVLRSPLAAPCPDETGPEDRSGGQRRYDALLTVIRRGLAGGNQAPTTPKATVNITIRYDPLTQALAGAGHTTTGEVLSPATVRRIACDAQLIPMVLGTHSEILDQGRAHRLTTPGQRRTLEHRDRECTFPGCTTPAPWCDAHHITHWSRGGGSDITNYALLCGRHHTIVHTKDLTATAHPTHITWHL